MSEGGKQVPASRFVTLLLGALNFWESGSLFSSGGWSFRSRLGRSDELPSRGCLSRAVMPNADERSSAR